MHCTARYSTQCKTSRPRPGLRLFIKSPLKARLTLLATRLSLFSSRWCSFRLGPRSSGRRCLHGVQRIRDCCYWIEWRNLGISNAVTAVVLVPALMLGAYHLVVRHPNLSSPRVLEGRPLSASVRWRWGFSYLIGRRRVRGLRRARFLYLIILPLIWAAAAVLGWGNQRGNAHRHLSGNLGDDAGTWSVPCSSPRARILRWLCSYFCW